MSSSPEKYDPNVIIASANERFRTGGGDLEGASLIFQSALLAWVDDAREKASRSADPSLNESIATLWVAYAQFLASAQQYKSATEAYEQAVTCPVAKDSGRVWLEYARFALDRNKPKTAQRIFVRALSLSDTGGGSDPPPHELEEQDRQLLWEEFLEATRESTGNPSLTLEELKAAIRDEQLQPRPVGNIAHEEDIYDDVVSPDPVSSLSEAMVEPPLKKPRLDGRPTSGAAADRPASASGDGSRTFAVTEEEVRSEAAALTAELSNSVLPGDVYGAWLLLDGTDAAISMPFSLFQPSLPKLSDPAGKDVLGIDVALRLIQKLADPSGGTLLLEVCQELWTLQAIVERSGAAALDRFDSAMKSHAAVLNANLKMRMSVSTAASRAAVQIMNDNEWRAFELSVGQQRQSFITRNVWELRRVLYLQQTILSRMTVPEFEGATIDPSSLGRQTNVCAYLHSAFYLRSRIGVEPHRTMLDSQIKRLEKDLDTATAAAVASRSHSPVPASGRSPRLSPLTPSHPSRLSPRNQGSTQGGGFNNVSPMSLAHPTAQLYLPAHSQSSLVPPRLSYAPHPQHVLPVPSNPPIPQPYGLPPVAYGALSTAALTSPSSSGGGGGYPFRGSMPPQQQQLQPRGPYPHGNYPS